MRIFLREKQFSDIVHKNRITEAKKKRKMLLSFKKWLLTALLTGSFTTSQILTNIQNDNRLDDWDKNTLSMMTTDMDKHLWKEIADDVVVTVYNATKEQCNADNHITASGFKLDLNDVGSHKIVAVERTFMAEHGLQYGDLVKIEGTYKGLQDGVYQIQDTMNKRYANQHKVDVLVPNDIKYGGTLKDSYAKMYVLKNMRYKQYYQNNMKQSI